MDLSIDYGQTRTLGNNILEKGNDFASLLQKITTENGLILKMLTKIEDAMNLFIENEKNFNRINKEEIIKIKLKMEKQRKIMKGQRQIAIIKAKYENMKKKLDFSIKINRLKKMDFTKIHIYQYEMI